ncbi:MAG: hypothetical protein ACK4ND_01270 [Cytophagaceae bacterium]
MNRKSVEVILIKYIFICSFLLLGSCESYRTDNSDLEQQTEEIISQELIDFEVWFEENVKAKHSKLISFQATTASEEAYEAWEEKPSYEPTPLEITYYEDSIKVAFYKMQFSGCGIFGNIVLEEDSLKLVFDNICDPNEEGYVEEIDLFKFTYVIHYDKSFKKLFFKPEQKNLLKKHLI